MEYRSVGRGFYFRAATVCLLAAALLLSLCVPVSASYVTKSSSVTVASIGTLAPPDGFTAVEDDSTVTLGWNAITGAAGFRVYRTNMEGINFSLVGSVTANMYSTTYTFTDGGLTNQSTYFYVVTTLDSTGSESPYSNEIAATPHLVINWVGTLSPQDYGSYTMGSTDPMTVTGKVFIPDRTGPMGPAKGVIGQFGYGTAGTPPANWTHWVDAQYAGIAINEEPKANDWYSATFRPEAPGSYNTVYRFSTTDGRDWVYGAFQVIDPNQLASTTNIMGTLIVLKGSDSTVPSAPGKILLVNAAATSVTLSWGAASDDVALYRYDIFRSGTSGGPYTLVGSVDAAASTLQFQDTGLVAGTKYYYVVQAVDTSFNRSAYSPEASVQTNASLITVTIQLSVPDFTPASDSIYLNQTVNMDGTLGGVSWTAVPLQPAAAPHTFTTALTLREGTHYTFLVSRGSLGTVEKNADGNAAAIAPDFTVTDGMLPIQRVVLNWDDPIVVAHWPDTPEVEMLSPVSVTWNQAMPATTAFTVTDMTGGTSASFPGAFRTDPTTRRTNFMPAGSFTAGRSYAVSVTGQPGINGEAQVVPLNFSFRVLLYHLMLPNFER